MSTTVIEVSPTAGSYAKAIAAAVTAGLGSLTVALGDGSMEIAEYFTVGGTTLVALGGVWAIPNAPETIRKYGKMITAGLIALAGALGTGFTDGGLSDVELITALIALISGLGLTYATPNAAYSDPVDPHTNKVVATKTFVSYRDPESHESLGSTGPHVTTFTNEGGEISTKFQPGGEVAPKHSVEDTNPEAR